MRSAPRNRSRWRGAATLALLAGVVPVLPAQERVDSVVESSRSALRLGDQTIRVLIGALASAAAPVPALERELSGGVSWNGRRYRGTIEFVASGSGVSVINRLELEDYLRGVLPGEIGTRDPRDRAALQAQAVAARSFAAARMGERRPLYDLTATVSDQVYGGMSVEQPETDAAVRATRGLVLTWGDRIITAPYHSHGGAMTAGADEVWKRSAEPYLRPVDDRAPAGGCFCDAGGTRGWERRFLFGDLTRLIAQYGPAVGLPAAAEVSGLRVSARGKSGRVTALELDTRSGVLTVRGNDIRFLLRTGGAILPSTQFNVEVSGATVTLRGTGNGHGVGMSQWGAIGRSRAGQDARAILAAYYPGTRLSPLL
jgi:stage II sporulation protein D